MPRAKNKEAAVGSQNRTVTPNEAKSALTHCIQLQRPIMMWGAPGIGKSDIVKQIADSEGRQVIDIRLPLWEPTDIKGIPYYNSAENNIFARLQKHRLYNGRIKCKKKVIKCIDTNFTFYVTKSLYSSKCLTKT